jgi:hypothetical protein
MIYGPPHRSNSLHGSIKQGPLPVLIKCQYQSDPRGTLQKSSVGLVSRITQPGL